MKMNTSYDELDTDIEGQLPKNEEHKWEERGEDCNRGIKGCIQDISKCLKWLLIWILFTFTVCAVLTYFKELIECREDGFCQYDEQHDYYLKENYNKTKHRRLTVAGVISHNRRHHHKTCEDYKFGCCEIYTECTYNQTDFTDYHTYTFHGLPKHDKDGTNCPRLLDLVTQHNYHYPLEGDFNCENSEDGCYKIETECDIRIRFMDVEDGFKDDVKLYKRNVNKGYKYTNLVERVGIEWKPSISGLMYEYRNKYPDKGIDGSGMIFAIAILAAIVMCSGMCNNKS